MMYKELYDQLIDFRKANPCNTDEYVEYHHIKPKSLYPDLINDKANIIALKASEHFKAHYYLMMYFKSIHDNFAFKKMSSALLRMTKTLNHVYNENITSDELEKISEMYEQAKLEWRALVSKKVIQFNLNGEKIQEFSSASEAARYFKTDVINISRAALHKKTNTFAGFFWRYENDDISSTLINKYKRYKDNLERGINGHIIDWRCFKINQFRKDGTFIKTWNSIREIQRNLGIQRQTIAYALKDINRNASNYKWVRFTTHDDIDIISKKIKKLYQKKSQTIIQYDFDGNFIRFWTSTSEITKNCDTKLDYKELYNKIRCFEKIDDTYIFNFRDENKSLQKQLEDDKNYIITKKYLIKHNEDKKKTILQFDKNGILIKEWIGFKQLARETGFSRSYIKNCIKGKIKMAYGFIWGEV